MRITIQTPSMAQCSSPAHLYPLSCTDVHLNFRLDGTRSSVLLKYSIRSFISAYLHKPVKATLASGATVVAIADSGKSISTLRQLCQNHVPDNVICRMEEIGYVLPTAVQQEALPMLFSGLDCVLHAQTGSGKTLAYLLQIFSTINPQRSAVQALIVVPTRELGMQVTKVARTLAAEPANPDLKQPLCSVMALLDGGSLKRHKSWLKAEPPTIVVATVASLCQMLEKQSFRLDTLQVLVVDEVDFMFNSSKQVGSLRKLLNSYSSSRSRQTIFASASIPQHNRFLYDCVQQKWTKGNVVHVHVNSVEPMPSCLHHKFVVCSKKDRLSTLLSLLRVDAPQSAIVFVGVQSEKSKKAGNPEPTMLLVEFLSNSPLEIPELVLLEEHMNFNHRAAALSNVRTGRNYLLIATDIAARGVDLPETTHIYNFDLPKDAVNYLHRAGRTGRRPFADDKCFVTTIITSEERFVLQRFENELKFYCEEVFMLN